MTRSGKLRLYLAHTLGLGVLGAPAGLGCALCPHRRPAIDVYSDAGEIHLCLWHAGWQSRVFTRWLASRLGECADHVGALLLSQRVRERDFGLLHSGEIRAIQRAQTRARERRARMDANPTHTGGY